MKTVNGKTIMTTKERTSALEMVNWCNYNGFTKYPYELFGFKNITKKQKRHIKKYLYECGFILEKDRNRCHSLLEYDLKTINHVLSFLNIKHITERQRKQRNLPSHLLKVGFKTLDYFLTLCDIKSKKGHRKE